MKQAPISLMPPLKMEQIRALRAGERVLLNGVVYAARDAAHKRMLESLAAGQALPFPIEGAVIYYVGPTPGAPGQILGAAGPTTSSRMDSYTPRLLAAGLRGMIGKGDRSAPVVAAMREHGAVYLAATGGAGALLGRCIVGSEVVAYPELGPEALRRLELRDFPALVAIDAAGRSLYQRAVRR
ncbi:MAG: FumA C-terminus/TtdB family hydratase beta subunit [Kiritimatiellia bacterium]